MRGLLAIAVLWAIGAAACRPTPSRKQEIVDAAPACGLTTVVRTRISGRFESDPGPPLLRIAVDVGGATPPEGEIARLTLALPRFAAEYSVEDLCTDDGSTADRIAVRCITHRATISRVVVTRDGAGLAVTEDTKQTLWEPVAFASRCFELHGLDHKTDLEPLRRTWQLDEPKCVHDEKAPPVKVTLEVASVKGPENVRCKPDGGHGNSARVTLRGAAGGPKDLGMLANMCGPGGSSRWIDVNGIELAASDMGLSRRFAYQLGDRVFYLAEDGRVRAADLPCGGRAKLDVMAPGLSWRETEAP